MATNKTAADLVKVQNLGLAPGETVLLNDKVKDLTLSDLQKINDTWRSYQSYNVVGNAIARIAFSGVLKEINERLNRSLTFEDLSSLGNAFSIATARSVNAVAAQDISGAQSAAEGDGGASCCCTCTPCCSCSPKEGPDPK